MDSTRYKAMGDITVNNVINEGPDNMAWVYAICSCTVESVAIFDAAGRLVTFNNRFGTLDNAGAHDLIDLTSLFRYYGRTYKNAGECLSLMRNSLNGRLPVIFKMRSRAGTWQSNCRAYPVLHNNKLIGVVLLASKERVNNGRSKLHSEDRNGAQSTARL